AVHLASAREGGARAASAPDARLFLRSSPGVLYAGTGRRTAVDCEPARMDPLAAVLGIAVVRTVRHSKRAAAARSSAFLLAARPRVLSPSLRREHMVSNRAAVALDLL